MRYYGRDGKPMTETEWLEAHMDAVSFEAMRRVGWTEVGGVIVSTVWLGIDVGYYTPDLPPLIFETMVFGAAWNDLDCYRYATEAAALAGHDQTVERAKAGEYLPPMVTNEDADAERDA